MCTSPNTFQQGSGALDIQARTFETHAAVLLVVVGIQSSWACDPTQLSVCVVSYFSVAYQWPQRNVGAPR